jgi:hypothetical protein
VDQGTLREAMTRSSGGFVAIYAVGAQAVLVVIGDEGLDTVKLQRESQVTLDAIRALIADNSPRARVFLPAVKRARWRWRAGPDRRLRPPPSR